jgi:C1A family cysteine protease
MIPIHLLGRIPDRHDSRDVKYLLKREHLPTIVLPPSYRLPDVPDYNQEDIGKCTAATARTIRRFLARQFAQYSAPDCEFSANDLYWQERNLPWNDSVDEDAGASIRDEFIVLAKFGICPVEYYPDDRAHFRNEPSAEAITAAAKYRIGSYHRIESVDLLKQCIFSGYPAAVGFPVYSSFESIGADGKMPMPKRREKMEGGHSVYAYGYDDASASILIQNWWGSEWGMKGRFWMPYKFIDEYWHSIDIWMGHLGKPW